MKPKEEEGTKSGFEWGQDEPNAHSEQEEEEAEEE